MKIFSRSTANLVREMHFSTVIASIALVASTWCSASQAADVSVTKSVGATSGPWKYVNGGLNTSFQYGSNDQAAPVIYSGIDGFGFVAGDSLVISYIDGLESVFGSYARSVDATGYTEYVINDGGTTPNSKPSKFFNHSDYDAYLGELSATFASSTGSIVGTPFKVGMSRTVIIPTGASQLQLGLNDDIFKDNTGNLNVKVTEVAAVPEPETYAMLLAGLGVLGLVARRRKSN